MHAQICIDGEPSQKDKQWGCGDGLVNKALLYKRETHNSDPQTLTEAGQNGTLL